jgi:hypothetical protein
MAGNKDKGDAAIRQDFPGGWNGDANNAFTKEGRTAPKTNTLILRLNYSIGAKQKTAIHTGKMTHYIPENNV